MLKLGNILLHTSRYSSVVLAKNEATKQAYSVEWRYFEEVQPTSSGYFYYHQYQGFLTNQSDYGDDYYKQEFRNGLLTDYSNDASYIQHFQNLSSDKKTRGQKCYEIDLDDRGFCDIHIEYYSKRISFWHQDGDVWLFSAWSFIDPWGHLIFRIGNSIYSLDADFSTF